MPKLTLGRGLPGGGKSTFARNRMKENKVNGIVTLHLEADMWMLERGVYVFSPNKLSYAHGNCLEQTRQFLERYVHKDAEVIVTNTFTRVREMEPYFQLVRDFNAAGMPVELEVFAILTDLTPEQLANRNTHKVPREAIERMANRWEEWKGEMYVSTDHLFGPSEHTD